jgi:hypothetical protein
MSSSTDARGEIEAPQRVARVVHDHALVDRRVRDAHVVALDREQHGRARGEARHMALPPLDVDQVVGREGLAQAQEQARDRVLREVAEREAEHEAQQPGGAEQRRDQRRRVQELEREQGACDHHRDAHQLPRGLA